MKGVGIKVIPYLWKFPVWLNKRNGEYITPELLKYIYSFATTEERAYNKSYLKYKDYRADNEKQIKLINNNK